MINLEKINDLEKKFSPTSLSEVDSFVNKLTRCKIRAFKREKGQCYLLDITSLVPQIKEYKRGMVFNFQYQLMTDNREIAEFVIDMAKEDLVLAIKLISFLDSFFVPLVWV